MRRTSYFGAICGRPPVGAVPLRPYRLLFSPRETGPAVEQAPSQRSKSVSDIADSSPETPGQHALARITQPSVPQSRQHDQESRTEATPELRPAAAPQSRLAPAPEVNAQADRTTDRAFLPPSQPVGGTVSQTDAPTRLQDKPLPATISQFLSPSPMVPERSHIQPRPEFPMDQPEPMPNPPQPQTIIRPAVAADIHKDSPTVRQDTQSIGADPPKPLTPAAPEQPNQIAHPALATKKDTSMSELVATKARPIQGTAAYTREPARQLQPRDPEPRPEPKAKRTENSIQIGTIEVEIVSQPAPIPAVAPRPAPVPPSRSAAAPAAKKGLSRGLSMHFGLRQG